MFKNTLSLLYFWHHFGPKIEKTSIWRVGLKITPFQFHIMLGPLVVLARNNTCLCLSTTQLQLSCAYLHILFQNFLGLICVQSFMFWQFDCQQPSFILLPFHKFWKDTICHCLSISIESIFPENKMVYSRTWC